MNHFTVRRLLAFSFCLMGLHAFAQEPTNYPTAFTATTQTGGTSVKLDWTGSTGTDLPSNYIIFVRTPDGTFVAPADTDPAVNDNDLSDDIGSAFVPHAVGANTYTWTGLPIDTDLEFVIYPYKTGAAPDPNYKNGGTAPTASATTKRPTLTSPTVGTILEDGATLGGTVTSNGGNTLLARGAVWNTTGTVLATDNPIAEGGTGVTAFTYARTGMPAGTRIYYAAYATNVAGTSLSPESSFFTLSTVPTNHPAAVTATAISSTQINLTFSSPTSTGVLTKGYIIVRNIGAAPPSSVAQDGVAPGSIDLSGCPDCALVATITPPMHPLSTTTFSNTGLAPGTDYYYAVIPFNWDNANPETYNYKFGTGFTVDNDVTFDNNSSIVLTGGGGGTTNNINYRTTAALSNIDNTDDTDPKSVSLATFQLQDGGGTAGGDADNVGTTLTSLTIQITNWENLNRISLFDGGDEVAGTEQPAAASVTFDLSAYDGVGDTGPLSTTDGGTNNFNIRAIFNSTPGAITDNESIHLLITGAVVTANGSQLAAVNAGGATTTTAGAGVNNVVVNSSRFRFYSNPGNVTLNAPFSITVRAVDNMPFYNTDLNYNGQIDVLIDDDNSTGTGDIHSVGAATLSPFLVNGKYDWTSGLRIDDVGQYQLVASDGEHADTKQNGTANLNVNGTSVNVTAPTLNTLCYGGAFQTLGNIVIAEVDAAGFSTPGGSLSLSLPTGFVFDPGVTAAPNVSGGADISAPTTLSYSVGNTVVTFSYTIGGTANTNTITISGLKIKYTGTTTPTPGTSKILRIAGTAVIAGDAVSDAKNHGTLEVNQPPAPGGAAFGFTVTSTDAVAINPNETNFSSGSNPINLVGSVDTSVPGSGTNSFASTAGGVTLVGSQYRFNPASLEPDAYPVTYTYTEPTARACQHTITKPLTVYASGINNLSPVYCNNDPASGALSVDQSFLNQIGSGLSVDHFVYYNFSTFSWINITNPDNTHFNPSLPEYQGIYNGGLIYGYPTGILIGFYVCDGSTTPCNGASTRFGRWQVVEVRPAPAVSFTVTPSFCEDTAPVTLVGNPSNKTNIALDNFSAGGGQTASVNHSTVGPNEVWTFSPAAVSGVDASTPQTFNLTYKYTDPVTGCDNTASKAVTIYDRPTIVPTADISPTGAPPSITLCQGVSVGSFTTSDGSYTYRWYADNPTTTPLKTGPTFKPPVDNTVAATTPFYVTRERNGCESTNNPRALSVVVNATPPKPTISDPTLEYCVNENVPDVVATGTNVKWYTGLGAFILQDPSPSRTQLGIDNTMPGDYSFYATQTANGCEGFIPGTAELVTVKIKALPNLALSANIPDVTKICTTGGSVTFSAVDQNDGNIAPNGTWSGTGLSGVLNPFPVQAKTDLNPLSLLPDDYTLQYAYTSAATNCSNTKTIDLTILPTITPDVSIGDVCDGFPAEIENNSDINPSSASTTIAQTEWTLGDGSTIALGASASPIPPETNGGRTSGTYLNPTHIYPNTGTFQISGAMVTSDGCRYLIPQQPVTVSPIPVISFTWKKACRDGTSETEFLATEKSTPQVPITTYDWNFNMNNTLTYTAAGTGSNPTVNYDANGTDIVRLIAISPAQCKDTVEAPVYIVPSYPVITEDNAYSQNFDTGTDGWIAGGANSSWALGHPQGAVVAGDASEDGSGNAWDTNLTGVSNNGEQSWVLSRCFDFTAAQKPIFSFDIWSDTPFQNDGAVLQYNDNGDIANDAAWVTIGQDNGQGANWYDASGISSSPGNQATNDVGWTGFYNGWRTAAFKLDALKGKPSVVFRIAFASNTPRREGFAFDNVFVGERTRTVLLESFTNSSAGANAKPHNDIFAGFSSSSNEVAKIEFHTAFPGSDPLNQANVELNNSRAAFYGITNTKMFSVDGTVVGTPAALNTLYDARVLTPSPLRINIIITKDGERVLINSTLTNTTNAILRTTGVNVFTTIVEKSIIDDDYLGNGGDTELTFVAKEMLPTPAGVKLTQDINPLETINVQEVVWRNRDLITSGEGAVVVYVQSIEGGNKNVYQAKIVDATEEPDVITGNEPTFTDQIIIYPNPATREVNIKLPAKSTQPLPVTLTDNFGRNVFINVFKPGEQTKVITTNDFAAGVYILQIQSDKGEIARRKVIVVGGR